jgi:hypothetical protein
VSPTVEYHCLNCLDNTVAREFDVSHLSVTCDACGEFGRFVNGHVLAKYREFEDSPPEDLDWERLDRMEQFLVAERIVRKGHTLEDFEIEVHDDEEETAEEDEEQTADDGADEDAAEETTDENGDEKTGDRTADVDSR